MAKRQESRRASAQRAASAKPAVSTVMLADDQLIVAEAMARMVGVLDHCQIVLVTCDALQLLASAERQSPNLVVIDAAMAQSFRAARALATRCPRTKVLMIDEFRLESHLRRAIDCGVAAYLTKCDAPTDLAAAVHKVLAGGLFLPDPMPPQHSPASSRTTTAPGNGPHGLSSLTGREIEVLTRLAEGLRVSEVARVLSISPYTVENHKAHVMRKLGLHKNIDLARFAIRHGLVSDE